MRRSPRTSSPFFCLLRRERACHLFLPWRTRQTVWFQVALLVAPISRSSHLPASALWRPTLCRVCFQAGVVRSGVGGSATDRGAGAGLGRGATAVGGKGGGAADGRAMAWLGTGAGLGGGGARARRAGGARLRGLDGGQRRGG